MTALSPLERKALKARAHHLNPVVLIGDAGLTPAVMREIDAALKSHELIKVRMAGDDRDARTAAYESICAELACAPVQHIGKQLVLYRPKPADPTASAKAKRPAGPRKTKKQLAAKSVSGATGTRTARTTRTAGAAQTVRAAHSTRTAKPAARRVKR
jgi:RNA-binding protein